MDAHIGQCSDYVLLFAHETLLFMASRCQLLQVIPSFVFLQKNILVVPQPVENNISASLVR